MRVVDWIPRTQYTESIAGGRESYWGYALNKLVVFNMTEFKKVIYMDADTLVLRNIDHLALEPSFTAAWTHACCGANDAPHVSGGLWVLEPDRRVGEYLWRLMAEGMPTLQLDGSGDIDESVPRRVWGNGDQQIVGHAFSDWDIFASGNANAGFPKVADRRHGYVAGLRFLPFFAGMNDSTFADHTRDRSTGQQLQEGFIPSLYDPARGGGVGGRGVPGVVWRALDVRYDQCVGSICDCDPIAGRDIPESSFTVHFSCLRVRPLVMRALLGQFARATTAPNATFHRFSRSLVTTPPKERSCGTSLCVPRAARGTTSSCGMQSSVRQARGCPRRTGMAHRCQGTT